MRASLALKDHGTARSIAFRATADVIGPIGLGVALGGVWLMLMGGSSQLLMSASALVAASQLLFFLNFSEPPVASELP